MANTVVNDADPADDYQFLLAEQRAELTAAQSLESDLDFAFRLQFEEAISASIANLPSSSKPSSSSYSSQRRQQQPTQNDTVVTTFAALQSEELKKTELELADSDQAKLEMCKTREELNRLIHDQMFAKEISSIPDDEWSEWGGNFEKPYGEGTSKSVVDGDDCEFRLYFKGLVSQESVNGKTVEFSGIGVAICGPMDNVIFELKKPLIGDRMNKNAVEIKALIEGLNAALSLELKRVQFFTDYFPLYQFITGRWPPKQRKIAVLVNQVHLLRREFQSCNPVLVARNDLKYGLKLARDAIVCQTTLPAELNHGIIMIETCVICLEDTDVGNMFMVDGCLHRYCFSCMKLHVENKLLHAMVPKCPHDGCKSELKVDRCIKFLTPKLLERLKQCITEASIPAMERVYCPYPKCSALMTRNLVSKSSKNGFVGGGSGTRKCVKCQGLFCINCKVPWHKDMTCYEYKRLNPNPPTEDVKLKSLASMNLWRQCVKCNHMIELSEGCYHMTCRCGYEFCYNCGATWENKKATCSCPLWDEDNILFDDDVDSDEEEVIGRFYHSDYDDEDEEDDDDWY
ncbi:hypothetical protein LWI28_022888 [Acer negundo]|uniref:RBR-type E3 ubiquitin transferase n=1 Tax=Acer negundo TaxID=4023 RepID=A0AAD5P2Y1_ACENE|nr:hypothetical protein LWI28_022888 [Acer negundo]KAK4852124.1 hypothetical protein QYF36_021278 [Acer negundo]